MQKSYIVPYSLAAAALAIAGLLLLTAQKASAADFSNVIGVDAELRIVERVTDKTIFQDIRRVQSYRVTEVNGSGALVTRTETNESAVIANSDVVIDICQKVQQLLGLSTEGCGVKSAGRTRQPNER
jgi:hypothetical protein